MSDDQGEPTRPKKTRKRRRGDEPETRGDEARAPEAGTPEAGPAAAGASASPSGPQDDARATAIRWPLLGAAAATVVGLALVGTGPSQAGMWVCVAGGVGLIASIHRLGRLGSA